MKYTNKSLILWASVSGLLLACIASAQTVHIAHCMAGCPESTNSVASTNNEVVVRQLFVASINVGNGLADFQSAADAASVYFKTIAATNSSAAFIFNQNLQQQAPFCDQLSTIAAVEAETGLTIFPQLQNPYPPNLHEKLTWSH